MKTINLNDLLKDEINLKQNSNIKDTHVNVFYKPFKTKIHKENQYQ